MAQQIRLELVQQQVERGSVFTAHLPQGMVARVEVPEDFVRAGMPVFVNGEVRYTLFFRPEEQLRGSATRPQRLMLNPFDIMDAAGNRAGTIRWVPPKRFSLFTYYEFTLAEQHFQLYEVALGRQGIKLPIYRHDAQVALVEKDVLRPGTPDSYRLILNEGVDPLPLVIMAVWYDSLHFAGQGENHVGGNSFQLQYTLSRRLRAMHDPEFKKV